MCSELKIYKDRMILLLSDTAVDIYMYVKCKIHSLGLVPNFKLISPSGEAYQ